MHATESLAATVGHWIGTNAFRLMPTDPTDESSTHAAVSVTTPGRLVPTALIVAGIVALKVFSAA